LVVKEKDATTTFKNVQGYMGDKQLNYPQMLAREVMLKGIQMEPLRDEIFVQIIKQLTNNPNPDSVSKGWKLMEMCLKCFPPSREFENFLEIYIRQQGESKAHCRTLLHEIVYSGARTEPLPTESIS
jgi:myosin-7